LAGILIFIGTTMSKKFIHFEGAGLKMSHFCADLMCDGGTVVLFSIISVPTFTDLTL
jgi:hypothetical protein